MAKTWYPVIDYMGCKKCGSCINKCSHGVYDANKFPMPVVSKPQECVNHCHGCGNICQHGAITYVGEDTGWTPPNGVDLSDSKLCCCCSEDSPNQLDIDFLYLDLNSCSRCKATDSELNDAIDGLSGVFDTLGYSIIVNRIEVSSPKLAEQYKFVSSPTILVNGRDIFPEINEDTCKDCGDLCGDDINCRVFVYNGVEYNEPPKAMIMDGILRAIYNPQTISNNEYTLPDNLKTFFNSKNKSCCGGNCSCSESCNE